MELVNGLYGKEHVALRTTIWEKGYMQGKMDAEHAIPENVVMFLDKAISAFYQKRIDDLLDQVSKNASKQLLTEWKSLLEEMHGYEQAPNKALYDAIMKDEKVSPAAKKWLLGEGKL